MMTLSVAPGKTTSVSTRAADRSGGQGPGDDACDGSGLGVAGAATSSRWSVGWVSMLMAVSLSQRWCTAAERGRERGCSPRSDGRDAPVWPVLRRGQPRSSWASSPRGGDAGLGEDVAQVECHRPRRDPALGGDVLVGQPGADELGDLELHRGQLHQGGGVALAGGLAGGAQLLGRTATRARRAGPRRFQGVTQVLPGVDAALGCGGATPRRPGGCALRRRAGRRGRGGPARPEQGVRLVGSAVIARP